MLFRLLFTIIISVAGIGAVSTARGEQFDAGGVSVALALPSGYCGLTRNDPVERLYYELQDRMQKGQNRIIEYAVPCKEVKRLRNREVVPTYAVWLMNAPGDVPREIPATASRQDYVAALAKEFPRLDSSQINSDVQGKAKKEGLELNVQDKFVVLELDPDAVYVGVVVKAQSGGNARDVAVAFAATTISGRLLSLNLYRPYESQQTFAELMVPLKAAIADTLAANP
jgi:hypothetical protein